MRRVDAESQLRLWLQRSSSSVHINVLRIPGIYALDREGGTPLDRVKKGMPVLDERDDVYTNHIHADDLARACVLALYRGENLQAIHVSDDAQMKMGDYYTEVAKWFNLPVPMRLPLSQLKAHLSPMQMSFLVESRRLDNQRMKKSLGLQLRYPTPKEGLGAEAGAGAGAGE
jgi:nucleoside-diphosphate-sugar epimerase